LLARPQQAERQLAPTIPMEMQEQLAEIRPLAFIRPMLAHLVQVEQMHQVLVDLV
jgi:hypothetical protein